MNDVAIIIPTLNRFEFLKRQLDYYSRFKKKIIIYIADSSKGNCLEKTQAYLDILRDSSRLHIKHILLPNDNGPVALKKAAEEVKEKYCIFSGDDDFQNVSFFNRGVQVLESDQKVTTVHGKGKIISLKNKIIFDEIISKRRYKQREISNSTASARIENLMSEYFVTHFSLHRTTDFVRSNEKIEVLKDIAFTELLTSSLDIVHGKSIMLNEVQFVRQAHENRNFLPKFFKWVNSPVFHESYEIYLEVLSRHLSSVDRIGVNEARHTIENSFQKYFFKRANIEFSKLKHSKSGKIQKFLSLYRWQIFQSESIGFFREIFESSDFLDDLFYYIEGRKTIQ